MRVRQLADGPFVVGVGGEFRSLGRLKAQLSRRVGAGFHSSGWGGAARRDGKAPVSRGSAERGAGPGPVPGEAEDAASAGGDELGDGGEQPKPQASGFPQAGLAGQGEQGHPDEQVGPAEGGWWRV